MLNNKNPGENFLQIDNNDVNDDDGHNYIEGAARTKVSRSSSAATESMGLNNANVIHTKSLAITNSCVLYITIYMITRIFTL